jgi:hypothetical protein
VQDGVASNAIGKLPHQKIHKTPWGKVKDIIQTRKDSLKKRHRHGKLDTASKSASEAAPSDHEEETASSEPARDSSDKEAGPTGVRKLISFICYFTEFMYQGITINLDRIHIKRIYHYTCLLDQRWPT